MAAACWVEEPGLPPAQLALHQDTSRHSTLLTTGLERLEHTLQPGLADQGSVFTCSWNQVLKFILFQFTECLQMK